MVPGIPEEQYYFTLATSVAGGLIAGFVSKLEPQGKRTTIRLPLGCAGRCIGFPFLPGAV